MENDRKKYNKIVQQPRTFNVDHSQNSQTSMMTLQPEGGKTRVLLCMSNTRNG